MSSCRRTVLKLMRSCLVVVVSLGNATHQRWDKAPAREFQEPPSLAEWTNTVRNPIPTPQHIQGPMGHFIAAVNSSIRAASPLESSTSSACWLSALIEMQIATSAEFRDSFTIRDNHFLPKLSMICSSLEFDRRVVLRIQERVADIRRSDYALAFSRLEQLLGDARSEKTDSEEQLNNQYRTISLQEARNAVSCESISTRIPLRLRALTWSSYIVTVLAFIFIPISLASSIFGMNVQQINETGHSIFPFIYTSIVLLTISGLSYSFRHSMKRLVDKMASFVPFVRWKMILGFQLLRMIWGVVVELCRSQIDKIRQRRRR